MTALPHAERHGADDVLEIYDRAAGRYDLVNAIASLGTGRWYRERTIRMLDLPKDAAVIDVGCGTGALASAAQRYCPESSLVVGVDPSEEMRTLARRAGVRDVRAGSFESLPFADASFDLVTSGYAIRYADDLDETARELKRILKPGGRLVLLEMIAPTAPWLRALVGRGIHSVGAPVLGILSGSRAVTDLMRHFWDSVDGFAPPSSVVRSLRAAGLVEAEYRSLGGLLGEFRAVRPDDD